MYSVGVFCFALFCFLLYRFAPTACGGSQARGHIRAIATGHSHSNAGFEPRLGPTTAHGNAGPLTH